MPREDFQTVTIRKDLIKKMDEYIASEWRDNTNIDSRPALMNAALDEYFQHHKPRFEHINTYEDHASILDRQLKTELAIYFKDDGLVWCEYDEKKSCIHIDYILSLADVQEKLRKKGWKRKI